MKTEINNNLKNFSTEGDSATAEISFPNTFSGFQGHFPDQPVLPGVCQIRLALVVAERMRGTRLALSEVVNTKFVAMAVPDQLIHVECRIAADLLYATLSSNGDRIAELKLRIQDA